ncbi:MAG: hypothetical protein OXH32_07250 [Acidobacteria bacterium]|nr:hypothetical protein [Acidobacteriota bacterium]MXZ39504.1 hypothetical protein [Holophagales bacterium]MYJ23995.1 hypothetical protein [Holophagales bacterium]
MSLRLHQTVQRLVLCAVAIAALSCAAAERSPGSDATAVVIGPDAVARDQLVAIGRDLELRGEARSDAVVLNGAARIDGAVQGDVIVLGGDVELGPSARLGGDVFVLGGRVDAESGAVVAGRTVAYPRAPSSLLVLAEGPVLGQAALSSVVAMLNLALLLAWLLVTLVLVAGFDPALTATAQSVLERPFRNFFAGLVAVLAVAVTFAVLTAVAPALLGVPLLAVCGLAILVCKLWGTAAVFLAVGARLLPDRLGLAGRPLAAALCGLLALGLIKMAPYVGGWTWTIVTCVGIGAALDSRLGRRDPWFAGLG